MKPKFKIGDTIRPKSTALQQSCSGKVVEIVKSTLLSRYGQTYYIIATSTGKFGIHIKDQDNYELVKTI